MKSEVGTTASDSPTPASGDDIGSVLVGVPRSVERLLLASWAGSALLGLEPGPRWLCPGDGAFFALGVDDLGLCVGVLCGVVLRELRRRRAISFR